MSLPLATGQYVHQGLEFILKVAQKGAQRSGEASWRDVARNAAKCAESAYRNEVAARGLEDIGDPYTIEEQAALIEALIFGWTRAILPGLLEKFDILAVEEEMLLPMSDRVHLMVRQDLVVRRKSDHKLFVRDFKTAATMTDNSAQEYANSVQMAIGTLAAEKRFGEPVSGYYIDVLLKGQWAGEYNVESGDYSGPRRQRSSLIYGFRKEANPPVWEEDWQYKWKYRGEDGKNHTLGKLYTKSPVWETVGVEYWVYTMPLPTLWENFIEIGPFERQNLLVRQYLASAAEEEERWISKVWEAGTEFEADWRSEGQQELLSKLFPRSYNCHSYGSRCSMYDICFRTPGVWEDPLASGKYITRVPHHAPELQQMKERGIVE